MAEEQVLCVPTQLLHDCGYFEGFATLTDDLGPLLDKCKHQFVARAAAEQDPTFKQLIPYIVLIRGGLILNYYRGVGQGETRLHGKRSIGIGGHINPCDTGDNAYTAGALRELHEELVFQAEPAAWHMPVVGLLNEDRTEVGRVHLGIVHIVHLDRGTRVEAQEKDILSVNWRTGETLNKPAAFEEFELWSRLLLSYYRSWVKGKPRKIMRGNSSY